MWKLFLIYIKFKMYLFYLQLTILFLILKKKNYKLKEKKTII